MGKKTNFKSRIYGYGNNNSGKGDWLKKALSGVIFAAACFFAAFVLIEFHSVYWLVIIAFVLLMGAAFFFLQEVYSKKEDVFDDLIEAQEALERTKEEDRQHLSPLPVAFPHQLRV